MSVLVLCPLNLLMALVQHHLLLAQSWEVALHCYRRERVSLCTVSFQPKDGSDCYINVS